MALSIVSKGEKKTLFSGEFYGYKGGSIHESEKIKNRKALGFCDSDGSKAELVTIEVDNVALSSLSYFDGEKWFFRGKETNPYTGSPV